jgi:penicillin-binding protein 2
MWEENCGKRCIMEKKKKKKKRFDRYFAMIIIMCLLFSSISGRLFFLQIVNGQEFKDSANNKSVRYLASMAPRGDIKDKNGIKLATSQQSYMLVYIETEESKKYFYDTFREVFKRLDSSVKLNGDGIEEKEKIKDEFELKVNPFAFVFKNVDPNYQKKANIKFKKDRGLHGKVIRSLYGSKKAEADLKDAEKIAVDEALYNVSAEDSFYDLVVKYGLYKLLSLTGDEEKKLIKEKSSKEITELLLKEYSLDDLRRYMIIKDSISLQSYTGYKPVVIASNIDRKTAFLFEQIKNDLPGIDITMEPVRTYPFNELGANFLGYISKINSGKQEDYEQKGYDINTDYIGAAGLEAVYEETLKGVKGGTTVKVNKYGRQTEELFKLDTYPGKNMVLTIDKNLQYVTERALAETMQDLRINHIHANDTVDTKNATRGAAVVLDVNTGAVLAMASLPTYDPNYFAVSGKLTDELRKQYFAPDFEAFGNSYLVDMGIGKKYGTTLDYLFPKDSDGSRRDKYNIYPKPLLNYATSLPVYPGSTFKPLAGIAGLEEGVITENTKILDAGIFDEHPPVTNNFTGSCWIWNQYKGSHGAIDVATALEKSCNYFFYEVGYRLFAKKGLNSLANYAWKFGLGYDPNSNAKRGTGIEISENKFGNVYNVENSKSQYYISTIEGIAEGLKKGKLRDNKFNPIDIYSDVNDTKEMATAKGDFRSLVKGIIENQNEIISTKETNDFYDKIKKSLADIVSLYPQEQKSSISNSDIINATKDVVNFTIFDMRKQAYQPFQVFNASIGQGVNEFTPIQLVNYMATFANGGTRYRVRLVDKIEEANGKVFEEFKPEVLEELNLKPNTTKAIKEGLRKVTGEDGTADAIFSDFPIKTAGKTGSATYKENGEQEKVGRTSYGLYLGFAPLDNPQIAVCVVIYDGAHGGYVAPVARGIYEYYFREELKKNTNFKPRFNYTLN